jgi:hypothetical protein
MKHQPLKITVKNGLLTISIGTATLAKVVEVPGYTVKCGGGLAVDIKRELEAKAFDGTNAVNALLDDAAFAAAESGSEALDALDCEV